MAPGHGSTALEKMLQHAVQLNNLLIPVKAVENAICNYAHTLFVWNHDETHPISPIGSCTAIHYRSKYFVLCTRHQLKALDGRNTEDIGLLDKDGSDFCSSAVIRHWSAPLNEVELHDLVVLDFTEPCRARPDMKERFFNFESLQPDAPSDQIIAFVVSGYPTEKQDYGLTEGHLGLHRAQVVCSLSPHGEQIKEDPTILRLAPIKPLKFDPNGMSGGSAFVIQFVGGNPHAYLSGIITRAGENSFYILEIGFIRKFIDKILETPEIDV
jgi:hypothetical protein